MLSILAPLSCRFCRKIFFDTLSDSISFLSGKLATPTSSYCALGFIYVFFGSKTINLTKLKPREYKRHMVSALDYFYYAIMF